MTAIPLALLDPDADDDTIDGFLVALGVRADERAQPQDDDHYYGAWSGGSKKEGGHPATSGGASTKSDTSSLAACRSVKDAEAYVRGKYGYADFTGIKAEDLPALKDSIAEIDRMAAEFPEALVPNNLEDAERPLYPIIWKFNGIGTTSAADCPGNVRDLMGDAWGATKGLSSGIRIWINTAEGSSFDDGSGDLGLIGFTVGRGAAEAMVHEWGHVLHIKDSHSLQDAQWSIGDVYDSLAKPRRQMFRDTSIYAGFSPEERYAEIFAVLHTPRAFAERSAAAKARLLRVQKLVNARANYGQGGHVL
jgi:hypothetical protein